MLVWLIFIMSSYEVFVLVTLNCTHTAYQKLEICSLLPIILIMHSGFIGTLKRYWNWEKRTQLSMKVVFLTKNNNIIFCSTNRSYLGANNKCRCSKPKNWDRFINKFNFSKTAMDRQLLCSNWDNITSTWRSFNDTEGWWNLKPNQIKRNCQDLDNFF